MLELIYNSPEPVAYERLMEEISPFVHPGMAHRKAISDLERNRSTSEKANLNARRVDINDAELMVSIGRRRLVAAMIAHYLHNKRIERVIIDGERHYTVGSFVEVDITGYNHPNEEAPP